MPHHTWNYRLSLCLSIWMQSPQTRRPTMRRLSLTVLATACALTALGAMAADSIPSYVTAAINDPARKAEAADDVRRQVAAVMVFTQVKPGQKVAELVPGDGYWT